MEENGTSQNDNTNTGNWTDGLKDDLKSNEVLKGLGTDINTLASSYLELHGSQPVVPDKYEITYPEGHKPEDYDVSAMEKFLSVAKELKLPQSSVNKLVAFNVERNNEMMEAMEANKGKQTIEATNKLKEKWGDKFEDNVRKSELAVTKLGGDPLVETLEKLGLTRNPVISEMFFNICNLIGEETITKGESTISTKTRERSKDGGPMINFPSMDEEG